MLRTGRACLPQKLKIVKWEWAVLAHGEGPGVQGQVRVQGQGRVGGQGLVHSQGRGGGRVMGSSAGPMVLDRVHGTGFQAESVLVQEVVLGGVEVTLVLGFDRDVGDNPFFQGVLAWWRRSGVEVVR